MKHINYETQIKNLNVLSDALAKKITEAKMLMHQVVQADMQLLQTIINPAFNKLKREPKNSKISRSNNGKRK